MPKVTISVPRLLLVVAFQHSTLRPHYTAVGLQDCMLCFQVLIKSFPKDHNYKANVHVKSAKGQIEKFPFHNALMQILNTTTAMSRACTMYSSAHKNDIKAVRCKSVISFMRWTFNPVHNVDSRAVSPAVS